MLAYAGIFFVPGKERAINMARGWESKGCTDDIGELKGQT